MWGALRVARMRIFSFRSSSLVGRHRPSGWSNRTTWRGKHGSKSSYYFDEDDSDLAQKYYDDFDFEVEGKEAVDASEEEEKELERQRIEELHDEMQSKTGRGWTDPWDLEEIYESKVDYDQLPDWRPDLVSRVSQERVQIFPEKIPTLQLLAHLPLPPPPPPHPGHDQSKAYALYRKRFQYRYILEKVSVMAAPRIPPIQALPGWEDKQDAIDELFENIEFELKEQEEILGKHPQFGKWVERALEEYLKSLQETPQESPSEDAAASVEASSTDDSPSEETASDSTEVSTEDSPNKKLSLDSSDVPYPTAQQDADAVPIFLDCYDPNDPTEQVVPSILYPLQAHPVSNSGRMIEEWELAAHKESKRIMLRQCTRQIARTLEELSQARIFVHGSKGVGKSAALAVTVAAARKSGSIVLYMPDGDRLRKNGYFIEPNQKREGIFDLPILSQEACEQFLASHKDDLASFQADKQIMERHFTAEQLERLDGYPDSMSVVDLLEFGSKKTSFAPMCYSAAIDVLMAQDETPFVMVWDEFNCYFDHGQYFHMDYDEDVKQSIPYNQISLFKPALDAMALSTAVSDESDVNPSPVFMKRGAVVVATTESHAVRREFTDGIKSHAQSQASMDNPTIPLHVCQVPRLSELEVEHMLANYEATGLGKFRLDQGDHIMNEQEVHFLRMLSGAIPQRLMDASIIE